MNKQGKDKIDWTDFTWNPVSGCLHDCSYCYLKRIKDFDMTPTFHFERLTEPAKRKKPALIFTGSSGDMFGEWVKPEWIDGVLNTVLNCQQHTFQFLTKNPDRYSFINSQYLFRNLWFGTTDDALILTQYNIERLKRSVTVPRRFVSFEPLIGEVTYPPNLADIQWIIIGADSNKGAKKPPDVWAYNIIQEARKVGAAVWVKDNYGYPETIKEMPEGMR